MERFVWYNLYDSNSVLKSLHTNLKRELILSFKNFNAESCYNFAIYTFRLVEESYDSYHTNRFV